jgi:hypothetical protein
MSFQPASQSAPDVKTDQPAMQKIQTRPMRNADIEMAESIKT